MYATDPVISSHPFVHAYFISVLKVLNGNHFMLYCAAWNLMISLGSIAVLRSAIPALKSVSGTHPHEAHSFASAMALICANVGEASLPCDQFRPVDTLAEARANGGRYWPVIGIVH